MSSTFKPCGHILLLFHYLCFSFLPNRSPKASSGYDGIVLVIAALHPDAVTHVCWRCHPSLLPGDP